MYMTITLDVSENDGDRKISSFDRDDDNPWDFGVRSLFSDKIQSQQIQEISRVISRSE